MTRRELTHSLLAALPLQLAAAPPDPPAMLEKALPGVVTIAVEGGLEGPGAQTFGFASPAEQTAYERALDLGSAIGSGSGFLVEAAGRRVVVTNAHVIAEADPQRIVAYSITRRKYPLTLLGADTFHDVAVLGFRNAPGPEVATLRFRMGLPRVGETVYAVGNPLGEYPYSVTAGMVSGLNRTQRGYLGRFGYIQSTAFLASGNSGGPLLDAEGLVVGVNTWIVPGRAEFNFAQQAGQAQRLVQDLLEGNGKLRRAYLGVLLSQLARGQRGRFAGAPVLLQAVVPGSPAAALQSDVGRRVESINGAAVKELEDAVRALEEARPGAAVRIELTDQAGQSRTASVTGTLLDDAGNIALAKRLMDVEHVERQPGGPGGPPALSRLAAQPGLTETFELLASSGGGRPRVQPVAEGTVPAEIVPIGIGQFVNEQFVELYRVRSEADVARALRLLAPSGIVTFLCAVPGPRPRALVVSRIFTDDPTRARRVLLY